MFCWQWSKKKRRCSDFQSLLAPGKTIQLHSLLCRERLQKEMRPKSRWEQHTYTYSLGPLILSKCDTPNIHKGQQSLFLHFSLTALKVSCVQVSAFTDHTHTQTHTLTYQHTHVSMFAVGPWPWLVVYLFMHLKPLSAGRFSSAGGELEDLQCSRLWLARNVMWQHKDYLVLVWED